MGFKVINSEVFELPGSSGRFIHLGTIHESIREFMVFVDLLTRKCYIEEITGGHLSFIEDDNLALELTRFSESHKLTDPRRLMIGKLFEK